MLKIPGSQVFGHLLHRAPSLPPRAGRLAAVWIAVALSATVSTAADPSLGSLTPWGGQRGTEVEVTLDGARLADAQQLLIYEPGLDVVHFEVGGDTQVKVRFAIADDCRPGNHVLRVRSASGISNLGCFTVGVLPEIQEIEPNSQFDQSQPIELGVTINGIIENEDVDYFVVEARQGERITAEVEGIRLGTTFFDPYVAILDQERFELAASDDAALTWQDGVVSIVAPEDGRYIIQLRESAYGGSNACRYRLHVGRFPRPRAVLPAGGRPGSELAVTWLGDAAGAVEETITLPTEPRRDFGLLARDPRGTSPSWNPFRLTDLDNVLEAEPNNSPAEATVAQIPAALNGAISESGDVDYFRFNGSKGRVLDIHVYARRLRTPLDTVLTVHRLDGAGLASNDDSGGPDSYLRFTVPEDGEYLLSVRDHLGQGGAEYVYRMEVTPVAPRLVLSLPEQQEFVDVTAPVPRGNRTALLVGATRSDFGGDLVIDMAGLPPGVSIETIPMPANQTVVPVLLTAAADAELAGALVDVTGRPVDENLHVSGRLLQTTSRVRGQNNIRVWDEVTDWMAAAVTEEVPFHLEIVQPQVPLVRDGRMDLKVVAQRAEGFTAPIAIRMLYNPPGVGSAGTISIAEGETEALIPLNANTNAELATWKIVVLGTATVGNGTIQISTQLADLEVAEPFFTFEIQPAAVEQGQATDVLVKVTPGREYPQPATVELLGLPNEVTTEAVELPHGNEELIFHVTTTGNSPAGRHKTLLCQATVTINGEPIVHMLGGGGELRVDVPLPPKADEPAPAPAAEPAAEPEPMPKRLTRLEKLRQDREQAKAAQAAAAAAAESESGESESGESESGESESSESESSESESSESESSDSESSDSESSDSESSDSEPADSESSGDDDSD